MLSILLARVPCINEPTVVWHEVVAAAPFLHGTKRVFHDLLDPFLKVAVLHYRYSVAAADDGFVLSAELARADHALCRAAPKRLRAEIQGRNAVVAVDGETCGGRHIGVSLKNRK